MQLSADLIWSFERDPLSDSNIIICNCVPLFLLLNTGNGSTMQNSHPLKYGYPGECAVLSFGRFLI